MAETRDEMCLACHVQIRPQVYLDVMAGEQVLTCDSCKRILYFTPTDPASPEAGSTGHEIIQPLSSSSVPTK